MVTTRGGRRVRRRVIGLALTCLGFVVGVTPAAGTGVFTLTPFTVPFMGARNAAPEAINNLGQIVGSYSDAAGHNHGFVRDARGHFSTINVTFPGNPTTDTIARGINDFGVIVGSYTAPADPAGKRFHGYVLARGASIRLNAPFAGAFNTRPRGINDYGAIVGSYDTAAGRHAFVRTAGTFSRLAVPFAGADRFAFACAINSLGQVLGGYRDATGALHGFLVTWGEATVINFPGAVETLPTGINDLSQIVGVYVDDRNAVHSFFESDGHFMTIDLPGIPTTILSRAHLTSAVFPALVPGVFGLSNAQITGNFRDNGNTFHGFLGVLEIPADQDRTRESARVGVLHP
jgi:uncharacterized membrane protein